MKEAQSLHGKLKRLQDGDDIDLIESRDERAFLRDRLKRAEQSLLQVNITVGIVRDAIQQASYNKCTALIAHLTDSMNRFADGDSATWTTHLTLVYTHLRAYPSVENIPPGAINNAFMSVLSDCCCK